MDQTKPKGLLFTFLWIYQYVKPYKKWLAVSVFALIFIVLINILKAGFISRIINGALKIHPESLLPLAGYFVVILAAGALISYVLKYSIGRFGAYAVRDLKNAIMSHILELQVGAVDRIHSGTLVAKFNNNLQVVENFIYVNLIDLLFQPVMFLTAMVYLGIINWKLLVVSLIFTPVSIYFSNRLGGKIGGFTKEYFDDLEKSASIMKDIFSGIEVVKSFCLQPVLGKQCGSFFERGREKAINIEKSKMFLNPFVIVLLEFPGVICILFGGYLTIRGEITVGELVAFFQMLNYVIQPTIMLWWMIPEMKKTGGAIESIDQLFQEKRERESGSAFRVAGAGPVIEFDRVRFGYHDQEEILSGISFRIAKGDKVAIVGASGSGKSTIFNLISGFYEAGSGSVKLFGREINQWNLAALREQIAFVSQESFLYPVSIAENILYGNPRSTAAEVETAVKTANAHQFIMNLPDGYQTLAGDGGARLSGGQRQRIAIARAILKDAPIILLDEPTSALDSQSEKLIHEALYRLSKDKTVLVIAHRLSTIQWADYILVIDEGTVKETGTHEELMRSGTIYQNLYQRQIFSGEDLPESNCS